MVNKQKLRTFLPQGSRTREYNNLKPLFLKENCDNLIKTNFAKDWVPHERQRSWKC